MKNAWRPLVLSTKCKSLASFHLMCTFRIGSSVYFLFSYLLSVALVFRQMSKTHPILVVWRFAKTCTKYRSFWTKFMLKFDTFYKSQTTYTSNSSKNLAWLMKELLDPNTFTLAPNTLDSAHCRKLSTPFVPFR